MEDWAEIRRLHRAERMPIKAIARVMGCSKNTVKAAIRAAGPPVYSRPASGSLVDEVEQALRRARRGDDDRIERQRHVGRPKLRVGIENDQQEQRAVPCHRQGTA